jgi:hypothetical protein
MTKRFRYLPNMGFSLEGRCSDPRPTRKGKVEGIETAFYLVVCTADVSGSRIRNVLML